MTEKLKKDAEAVARQALGSNYDVKLNYRPMHIMPVRLLRRAGRATFQRARQHWGQMHRLIQQAVEQQSTRTGRAPIEAKRELVRRQVHRPIKL